MRETNDVENSEKSELEERTTLEELVNAMERAEPTVSKPFGQEPSSCQRI